MANIDIFYKGLTGLHNPLTIDDGQTFAQLRTAIISDETLASAYYGRVSITKNGTFYDSTDNASTTLATAGLGDDDVVTVASARPQATKQVQQEMMLDIAELKRAAGGDTTKPYYRARNSYDVTTLPTRYVNDTVTDNTGDGGTLAAGRPWS